MFNSRLILVVISTLALVCASCESQNSYDGGSLNFQEVRSFARSHFLDSIPEASKVESFSDFDFLNLKAIKGSRAEELEVKVYYNEKNEIVKIGMLSDLRDNDFEFRVVRNEDSGYSVLYAEEFYDQHESQYIYGFFIVYKAACYFVSFENPLCIMRLDSHLKAIQTLRFKDDDLTYKTTINYRDSIHLYSESFFKPTSTFSIDEKTTLENVIKCFDSEEKFITEKELVIGLVPELDHIPLWTFEGHHEYDMLKEP
ncbi:MAG: hypothetical protein ACOYXT_02925 [Bacteroidota bacterium]